MAVTKWARASGIARPRGAKACRSRKKPVMANALATSVAGCRRCIVTQECRQRQELVAVVVAAGARHGAARARRHIDQIGGCSSGGAGTQIETETKLGEKGELEARDRRRGDQRIVELVEDRIERAVDRRMWLALGEQPAQCREMSDAVHGVRRREIAGRAQVEALDHIVAEMLVEPRPPRRAQRIAWLQYAAQPRAVAAAAHQAEMAAALQRHQFENDARLAMALDAEHNAFVGPLHAQVRI